jgi:hypothetical protein
MIVTDIRQKLFIFMLEQGMTQKELARELGYNYEHINAVFCGRYEISDRLYKGVENLFKRFDYYKALDDEGRL